MLTTLSANRSLAIFTAAAASSSVFAGGIVLALGRVPATSQLKLQSLVGLGALIAAAVGRLAMMTVQVEASAAVLKSTGRRAKVELLQAILVAQWPLIGRDAGLGLLAGWGLIDANYALSLSANIFDPFLLWSALRFRTEIRKGSLDNNGQVRQAMVVYVGYLVVAKVLVGLLAGILSHSGG